MTKASEQNDTTNEKDDGKEKKKKINEMVCVYTERETLFVNMKGASGWRRIC